MKVIPRFDLNLSWSDLDFALGRMISGEVGFVPQFEKSFAQYLGAQAVFLLPSARGAMRLLLENLELKKKAVLVSAFNHPSMPRAVLDAGLELVYGDISLDDYSLDPAIFEEREKPSPHSGLLDRLGAVILPHLYGNPGKLAVWQELSKKHGFVLLEDCAQSCGAYYGDKLTGSFGLGSIFSFALTKNFTTLGGGLLAVNDEQLADRIEYRLNKLPLLPNRRLIPAWVKALGMKTATCPGFFSLTLAPALELGYRLKNQDLLHSLMNEKTGSVSLPAYRGSELQARLGLRKLPLLEAENQRRAENGRLLREQLSDIPGIEPPGTVEPARPIYLSFVVRAKNPGPIARELLSRGVDTAPGYLGCQAPDKESYPNALKLEREQLHLPVYPRLAPDDLTRIAQALKEAVQAQ